MLIDAITGEDKVLLNTDFIECVRTVGDTTVVSTYHCSYKTEVSIEGLKKIMGYSSYTFGQRVKSITSRGIEG